MGNIAGNSSRTCSWFSEEVPNPRHNTIRTDRSSRAVIRASQSTGLEFGTRMSFRIIHAGIARKNPRSPCGRPAAVPWGRSRRINSGRFHSLRSDSGRQRGHLRPPSLRSTSPHPRISKKSGKHATSRSAGRRRETRGDSFGWPPVDLESYRATRRRTRARAHIMLIPEIKIENKTSF